MNLILEKDVVDKLNTFVTSNVEVGGNFIYEDGGNLSLGSIYYGDRFHIDFDQYVSKFNFHTHPIEPVILHSFYSFGDVISALRRQSLTNKIRKDFLVTDDGIYSLQLSSQIINLYKQYPNQIETLLSYYQRYVVQPKMNPFGDLVEIKQDLNPLKIQYACNIIDMINMLNNLSGTSLFNWMISEINKNRLSFKDQFTLASYLNLEHLLKKVNWIYYINFMPWGEQRFIDKFKL